MRTGTFYLSHEAGKDTYALPLKRGGVVYVRIVESKQDLSEALDAAKPKRGEMLMNTHPLPEISR